jgi:tRNA (cmo5U34)-methyltransferase
VTHNSTRDFDAVARAWDDNPARLQLALAIADSIRREIPLSPHMTAMDFGSGTGLLTLALQPDLAHVLAVDTSAEMLKVLAEKAQAAGLDKVETLLWDLTASDLVGYEFDLIFSGMVLHHIPDPQPLLLQLAGLLRPGGRLAFADLDEEEGDFHPDPTGVFHHGFSARQMQDFFASAGLSGLRTNTVHAITRPTAAGITKQFPVLLTVGQRE